MNLSAKESKDKDIIVFENEIKLNGKIVIYLLKWLCPFLKY